MVDLTSDISKLVFRQVLKDDGGEISIDGKLLGIFLELDGQTELGVIARKAGLNLGEMRKAVSKLLELNLIEPAVQQEASLDQDFLDFLSRHLAEAVGPIAGVLIEDHFAAAGYQFPNYPVSRVAELVNSLAAEIRREEKKEFFTISMLNKMKQKGYGM